jgi:putative peptidoglycan lipid II flippase
MGEQTSWAHLSAGKRALWLSGLMFAGAGSYFATLFVLGFRPTDFKRSGAH